MWRNKDWKNSHKCYCIAFEEGCGIDSKTPIQDDAFHHTLEYGADAILKAIQSELIACSSTFETMNVIETIFGASIFQED